MQPNKLSLREYLTTAGLTPRQIDVAALCLTGKPSKEMAATLFVTEQTIKFHLTDIYKKLKVKNRVQLFLQLQNYVVSDYLEVRVSDDNTSEAVGVVVKETVEHICPTLPTGVNHEQKTGSSEI